MHNFYVSNFHFQSQSQSPLPIPIPIPIPIPASNSNTNSNTNSNSNPGLPSPISDLRFPISDLRFPISDFRFPISDLRFPIMILKYTCPWSRSHFRCRLPISSSNPIFQYRFQSCLQLINILHCRFLRFNKQWLRTYDITKFYNQTYHCGAICKWLLIQLKIE